MMKHEYMCIYFSCTGLNKGVVTVNTIVSNMGLTSLQRELLAIAAINMNY